MAFQYLCPEAKIIAPWRIWELKSREEEIEYAIKHKIDVPVSKEKPYSSDANLWHISYEGGILEDLSNAPKEDMFNMTVSPKKAPQSGMFIEIFFSEGVPVKLKYGNKTISDSVKIVDTLNKIVAAGAS